MKLLAGFLPCVNFMPQVPRPSRSALSSALMQKDHSRWSKFTLAKMPILGYSMPFPSSSLKTQVRHSFENSGAKLPMMQKASFAMSGPVKIHLPPFEAENLNSREKFREARRGRGSHDPGFARIDLFVLLWQNMRASDLKRYLPVQYLSGIPPTLANLWLLRSTTPPLRPSCKSSLEGPR